jgi:two-component system, NtrC family, sensor kinase
MTDHVSFMVGAEKRLTDILSAAEVMPLLEGAIKAGAGYAALLTPDGEILWEAAGSGGSEGSGSSPVMLEGEPVGGLVVRGEGAQGEYLNGIEALLLGALQSLINAGLKRVLTTEIHTAVVNQSYEDLLETNRQLSASEGRYRELAGSLEQKIAERTAELEQAHTRLLQQQKMASVGQLAAGMAHEINNPLGFITSNLHTLQKYVARLVLMLDYYGSLLESDPAYARFVQISSRKWQELKLDSICADLEALIGQSLEGADRVKKIVADLKGFSHIDDTAVGIVDLNTEIDRTLSVLEYRFPPGTDIVKNYRELPGYCCNPAQICQLFLHVIENALEARSEGPRLIISTSAGSTAVTVSFADNGPGIPEEIRGRVFDPFFTTKEVGAGTGMGLAVVYDIVTGLEGGVEVTCPAGGGTIVTITLPLQRKRDVTLL